jgi:hypothetical protein
MGYGGGALRSRGSFEAGQLRSGLNPRDEFEFRWGDGYVGGRGYGGTNYDLTHGYRVGGTPRYGTTREARPTPPPLPRSSSPATRGGYSWSEYEPEPAEFYGPARYGYGPYFERLRRHRRSDEEIRADVEDALFYDTWVDADRIEIEVEEGIVTLRGTLPNFDEVRFATDDAWDVDGVRGVRSEFEVGPQEGEAGRVIGDASSKEMSRPSTERGGRSGRETQRSAKGPDGSTSSSAGSSRARSTGSKRSAKSSSTGAAKGAAARKKGGEANKDTTEG